MAFLDDMFKGGNVVTGLAIAVGAAVLAPIVVPAVGNLLRPAAKAVVKGGILAYDRGRQAVAQLGEVTNDLAAEARAKTQHAGTGTIRTGAPTGTYPAT